MLIFSKKGDLKKIILYFIILSIVLFIFVVAEVNNSSSNPVNNKELATIINGQSIDTPYINSYLEIYNDFEDIEFKDVANKKDATFTIGNKEDNIKGYRLNSKNYAIHLMHCDKENQGCYFRINGIPTGKLDVNSKSNFNINEDYKVKINSIKFDFCDGARFCDTHFEAYDVVNVSIKEKTGK